MYSKNISVIFTERARYMYVQYIIQELYMYIMHMYMCIHICRAVYTYCTNIYHSLALMLYVVTSQVWLTPDKYLLVSNDQKYVHDIVSVCLHENTACSIYCQHATKHHYMQNGTSCW